MPILQFNEAKTWKISRRTSCRKVWRLHLFLDHGLSKIGDKTFEFRIILDGATQLHANVLPHRKLLLSFMSGWTHSRRTRKQFVLVWLSTILTTCRHSTECTLWREFQQEHIHHGRTEQRWGTIVQGISLGTRGHSFKESGPDHADHSCPVYAQGGHMRMFKQLQVVRRPWNWPWDEDQENSWTQLRWIQSSWHQHLPSRIFSMKTFKNWPWPLIFKISFREDFVKILLNGWNFFFPIFEQEKMCFVNKKIAKSSKDGSLANGWKWKSFQSKDPWQLLVLAPLSFNQISANWGDKRPSDTVDLEELPDSREQARAPRCMTLAGNVFTNFFFERNSWSGKTSRTKKKGSWKFHNCRAFVTK